MSEEKKTVEVVVESKEGEKRPDLDQKLSELEILKQSLDEIKKKERETYDQLLRLGAEFDNFRKRQESRVAEARSWGKEEVLTHVIGICDSLIHATEASQKATDVDSLKKGLKLVYQQFEKFLKDQGIQAIPAEGKKLDPHLHDVIAQEENSDKEEGTILSEIQRGYTLNGRVVRPSRVKVSVKPVDATASAESQDDQKEENLEDPKEEHHG